mmetsp:Transcript_7240/g.21475  ORF Transcript_7240/g.21475 Transcript_7240/m.21475 type:complete len:166 (-) Transcript_7240:501-998(-)
MASTEGNDFDPFGLTQVAILPPKCDITIILHEEVTSIAAGKCQAGSAAHTNIEGSLHASFVSSDARKNVPFELRMRDTENHVKSFVRSEMVANRNIVTIPKSAVGNVPLASYTCDGMIRSMPIVSRCPSPMNFRLYSYVARHFSNNKCMLSFHFGLLCALANVLI